jgi:hypothetical protein
MVYPEFIAEAYDKMLKIFFPTSFLRIFFLLPLAVSAACHMKMDHYASSIY